MNRDDDKRVVPLKNERQSQEWFCSECESDSIRPVEHDIAPTEWHSRTFRLAAYIRPAQYRQSDHFRELPWFHPMRYSKPEGNTLLQVPNRWLLLSPYLLPGSVLCSWLMPSLVRIAYILIRTWRPTRPIWIAPRWSSANKKNSIVRKMVTIFIVQNNNAIEIRVVMSPISDTI